MPKTKFQGVVFTAMMVFVMVWCMTIYTLSINSGGLHHVLFGLAIREMWVEYVVVFCLIFFVITRTAKALALRILPSQGIPPIFLVLAIQCFTVCQIVPVITLFATLFHNGLTPDWLCQWLQLAVLCFPMALCLQVFFAGPLVRLVFRTLFCRPRVRNEHAEG